MDQIWIIAEIDYEFVSIVGAFDSKEKAEAYLALFEENKDYDYDIFPVELNPFQKEIEDGQKPFMVYDNSGDGTKRVKHAKPWSHDSPDKLNNSYWFGFANGLEHAIEQCNRRNNDTK